MSEWNKGYLIGWLVGTITSNVTWLICRHIWG